MVSRLEDNAKLKADSFPELAEEEGRLITAVNINGMNNLDTAVGSILQKKEDWPKNEVKPRWNTNRERTVNGHI